MPSPVIVKKPFYVLFLVRSINIVLFCSIHRGSGNVDSLERSEYFLMERLSSGAVAASLVKLQKAQLTAGEQLHCTLFAKNLQSGNIQISPDCQYLYWTISITGPAYLPPPESLSGG